MWVSMWVWKRERERESVMMTVHDWQQVFSFFRVARWSPHSTSIHHSCSEAVELGQKNFGKLKLQFSAPTYLPSYFFICYSESNSQWCDDALKEQPIYM